MEEMNVHEMIYKNKLFVIKVIDKIKVSSSMLTVLGVTMSNSNSECSTFLGNFYTDFPQIVSESYMNKFVKKLVDNIDTIIFDNNRYIGEDSELIFECLKLNPINLPLSEIYSEFLEKPTDSKEYIKYSQFLELYFSGHMIDDSIRRLYLKKHCKSILDFDNVDNEIKSEFSGSMRNLCDEYEYKQDLKHLKVLEINVKNKKEEIDLLKNIIDELDDLLHILSENDRINMLINEFVLKAKSMSLFNKERKDINKSLKRLRKEVVLVDIEKETLKLKEKFNIYASLYGDTSGLLVLFDDLELVDILKILNEICYNRETAYNVLVEKYNVLNDKILNDNHETLDISDLYDRLEIE